MLDNAIMQTVLQTVPVLEQHGAAIVSRFYARLLDHHPELKRIFNLANQRNGAQPTALTSAVYAYARHIENPMVLANVLEKIAHKHASLQVQPSQYAIVGTELLGAMQDVLGNAATPAILDAWGQAYSQLADVLIQMEAKLYDTAAQAPGGWRGWRTFRVIDKQDDSRLVTSFTLAPVDGLPAMDFHPGQFVSLSLHVPALGHIQIRQYSLSDAPNGKTYRISVKRESGATVTEAGCLTQLLHDTIHYGDTLELSPPFGVFHLQESKGPIVMISGGVGITPMVSMVNRLHQQGDTRPITFIHGARNGTLQPMRSWLRSLSARHRPFRSIVFYDQPEACDRAGLDYDHAGPVALAALHDTVLQADAEYYLCGPLPFMREHIRVLSQMGVPHSRLHYETFGPDVLG